MPVIKANAYGHGAADIASALLDNAITSQLVHRFAVNRVSEGVELRRHLRQKQKLREQSTHHDGSSIKLVVDKAEEGEVPIVVLGYGLPDEMRLAAQYHLTPAITEVDTLKEYCKAVLQMKHEDKNSAKRHHHESWKPKFHIKVDTGMGRFGLLPHEVLPFVKEQIVESDLVRESGVQWEGLFTHFSVADELENEEHIQYTRNQYEIFDELRRDIVSVYLSDHGTPNQMIASRNEFLFHCSNSAASLFYPEYHMDMVRPGVSIYGLSPRSIAHDPKLPFELKPALMFKSHLARVKTLPPGSSISYGRTFSTPSDRDITVGLVPVGYGDGYHRLNSNRGHVLVNGKKAPICGRVCMDQFIVDLTECGSNVQVNDEVVLIGKQGDEEITAEEVASWSQTINYEVTTSLLVRAPRVFVHSN